jgi:hypothetical protein
VVLCVHPATLPPPSPPMSCPLHPCIQVLRRHILVLCRCAPVLHCHVDTLPAAHIHSSLYWPLMRRAHGSTCRNALCSDLEPGARCGGPTGQWRGHACATATSTATPPHHHPHIPATTRPCQLIGLPSKLARLSSKTSTTDLQQIRAQGRPDPPQYYQNHLSSPQDPQDVRGPFGLKQTMPPMGLSALKLPLPRRRAPDIA